MKITVTKDGELLEYLVNNVDVSRKTLKQYLEHGSIYVNNNRTTKYNYLLKSGMTIIIDTKKQSSLPFEVLFEDDYIIVVNKPSGLLTIATEKEHDNTLYHLVGNYLKKKNKNSKVFIVHRLDKETSGIVILAKDMQTKNMLQKDWNEIVKLREYIAVVSGSLVKKSDRIVEYLNETKTGLVYKVNDKNGKEAITNYEVLKENKDYSLVKVLIETGRRNQIRVAFAGLHHPIVGDSKYDGVKEDRLYLHANRLKIYYPIIKKEILFETETPIEFKKIMR